ncbi:hypothetical protein B484DRAFT_428616 [Ochromonadaceae sp. CCMP2298]|nr:hypothetical protein B484DRAFT_428616 [Ochromonadaceae sp. CCMP2298]
MAPKQSKFSNTGANKRGRGDEQDLMPQYSQEELVKMLQKVTANCNQGVADCCIFDKMTSSLARPSMDSALGLIQECREFIDSKNEHERKEFFVAEFNASILNFHEVLDCSAAGWDAVDEEQDILDEIENARQRVEYCLRCGDDPLPAPASAPTVKEAKKRFAHDFRVQNRSTKFERKPVCPKCWRNLYGFTKHMANSQSAKLRKTNTMFTNPHLVSPYVDNTLHDFGHMDTMKMLTSSGVGVMQARAMASAATAPSSLTGQRTAVWLEEFFFLHADCAPNSMENHLEVCDKKDIWVMYKNEMQVYYTFADRGEKVYYDYDAFLKLWSNVFPWVKVRVYKSVSGKCWTCYHINEVRKTSKDRNVLLAAKRLHQQHRGGLYMLERLSYKKRVRKTLRPDKCNTTLSVIIDGMDQSHCKVPMTQQASFEAAITQHLTGALVHGQGLTLFRNLPHVGKGSNLAIHTILLILDKWRREHEGNFPEEMYVQLDGGAENANKYVLAFMDWLVSKRIVKRVYFTRLPVGHTHEDIDACFGVIWNSFKKQNVHSLQEFKIMVEAAMRDSKIPTEVVDIHMVPNYKAFFLPFIDPALKKIHKLDNTVHQWRFEAVEPDPVQFPRGVKIMYRTYASEEVVKIVKKPKRQCKSADGTLTGLEAVTCLVSWQPVRDLRTGKEMDGMYILRGMPELQPGGAKGMQVDRLKEWDLDVVRNILKPLSVIDSDYARSVVQAHHRGDEEVGDVNGTVVLRRHMWGFQEGNALSPFIIGQFLKLMQAVDDLKCTSHAQYNMYSRPYFERKHSVFCDVQTVGPLLTEGGQLREDVAAYLGELEPAKMHRLYIPIYTALGDSVELVVVNIEAMTIHYINPVLLATPLSITASEARRSAIRDALLPFLNRHVPIVGATWLCTLYPQYAPTVTQYTRIIPSTRHEAGMYLIILLQMLSNDLPLVFNAEDISHVRPTYPYLLVCGELPL